MKIHKSVINNALSKFILLYKNHYHIKLVSIEDYFFFDNKFDNV